MAKKYILRGGYLGAFQHHGAGVFHDNTSTNKVGLTSAGVLRTVTVVAAGGATGKSNPLYGCLGGCLRGQIG